MTTHQGTPATRSGTGIGFTGLLTLLFIALKLLDVSVVASWSWWWVILSPTLAVAGAFVIGFLIVAVCALVVATVKA